MYRAIMLGAMALLLLCGGCNNEPMDLQGVYTIALTNRENGCNFNDWQVNDTTTGVQLTVSQSGESASGFVGGTAGAWLTIVLGSQEFSGAVDGSDVRMTLHGSIPTTVAGCTWTIDAILTGTLTGDTLAGDIQYTPSTNNHDNCAAIEGCVSRQQFNGVRAPQ